MRHDASFFLHPPIRPRDRLRHLTVSQSDTVSVGTMSVIAHPSSRPPGPGLLRRTACVLVVLALAFAGDIRATQPGLRRTSIRAGPGRT
jgi:hypothetical protein